MTIDRNSIEEAERLAAGDITRDMGDHFVLLDELTDVAGALLESVEEKKGGVKAVHAAAILLARMLNDVRACACLVQSGYAGQAAVLVASSLEIAHIANYIGPDEARAAEWFAHKDPKSSYPGSVKQCIQESAVRSGVDPADAEREYEVIYRELCMFKHANPLAVVSLGVMPDAPNNSHLIVVGPIWGESARQAAHAAVNHSLRYLLLVSSTFIRYHVPDPAGVGFALRLNELADKQQELLRADLARFAAPAPGTPAVE